MDKKIFEIKKLCHMTSTFIGSEPEHKRKVAFALRFVLSSFAVVLPKDEFGRRGICKFNRTRDCTEKIALAGMLLALALGN